MITNTNTTGNKIDGNYIGVGWDGATQVGNQGNAGVEIDAAFGNWVGESRLGQGNVISGNKAAGVYLDDGATTNNVVNNLIGTDKNGSTKVGNGTGVALDAAVNNTIGGDDNGSKGLRNFISGNVYDGVYLCDGSNNNSLLGNYIGTDKQGESPLGNGANGVYIYNSSGNSIGDGTKDGRNVISANGFLNDGNPRESNGIFVRGSGSSNNVIQGNYIGTMADGTVGDDDDMGNDRAGVYIEASAGANNSIGGNNQAAGNLIAANWGYGIDNDIATTFIDWNFVGVTAAPVRWTRITQTPWVGPMILR